MTIFVWGCQPAVTNSENSSPSISDELNLCSESTLYSPYATVNGTATFSKRGLSVQTSSGQVSRFTLSSPISTNLPIRFAEVRVLDSNGAVVQCGKTNGSGSLKALDGTSDLRIPAIAGNYTVQILSRSNHTMSVPMGKAVFQALFSVKEDIYSNTLYKISAAITTTGTGSYSANANATALETISTKIEGGAFNIYNDIITAYDYLANSTGTQNLTCLSPKMSVFWKAGFNPNQYIYPSVDPADLGTISYYLRSDKELYINGGILGDVATVDTDHFDDSVIIHELGHHVENSCGTMDSPGGSHSGSSRIDGRLAWSEGWGNYFGAHVIKNKLANINPDLAALLPNNEWLYYFDSEGYTDGSVHSGYEYIKFNLARVGNSDTTETIFSSMGTGTYEFDRVYPASYPGEGHFREVAISRALFKASNSCSSPFANCVNEDNFGDLWKSFEKDSTGMGQSIYPFRNSARLLERFKAIKGGSLSGALNNLFANDEGMQMFGDASYSTGGYTTWVPFGIKLVPSVTPCPLKIKPKANNSSDKSDQRFSNHFYYVDKSALPGVTAINLNASYVTGTPGVNIDLLLFNESYRYNEDCDGSTCSKTTSADVVNSNRTAVYPKALAISGLSSSSKYLLNVRAYTPGTITTSTEYSYTLTDQIGGYLCPSTSY